MNSEKPIFFVDHSTMPPTCLPTDVNTSNLMDVTGIGDEWKRYIDTQTGKVHDGAVYAKQMRRLTSPVPTSLPADITRCAGSGSDTEGWRNGCEDCLRRTAPATDHPRVSYMAPPVIISFDCPHYLPPAPPASS
jgi:hypothetical protein